MVVGFVFTYCCPILFPGIQPLRLGNILPFQRELQEDMHGLGGPVVGGQRMRAGIARSGGAHPT